MFFATGIILHRVMSYGKSAVWSRTFASTLSAVLIVVAVYHCYAIETLAHQATFVIMVIMVARKTNNLIDQRIVNLGLRERTQSMARTGASMSSSLLGFQHLFSKN